MPGMDGLTLLREIKARQPDLPVMMVTAYGDDERRRLADEYGAAHSSPSPRFRPAEGAIAISQHCRMKQLSRPGGRLSTRAGVSVPIPPRPHRSPQTLQKQLAVCGLAQETDIRDHKGRGCTQAGDDVPAPCPAVPDGRSRPRARATASDGSNPSWIATRPLGSPPRNVG